MEAQSTLLFPTEQVAPAQPSAFGHRSQPVPGGVPRPSVSVPPAMQASLPGTQGHSPPHAACLEGGVKKGPRDTLLHELPALRVGLRRVTSRQPPSRNEAGPCLARPSVLGAALLRTHASPHASCLLMCSPSSPRHPHKNRSLLCHIHSSSPG